LVCLLVIGVYAYSAHWGPFGLLALTKEWDSYYSSLVEGFRVGQLNVKKEVPPGLVQVADPYDPSARASRPGVGDLSYYKGKLYLYFGVTPALVLFWPYVALTGHYLSQKDAGLIFCIVGFLVSVGLLCALWRRYFAAVSVGVVAAGTLALGLATLVPLVSSRCGVWEVPVSCGYALTMLALAGIWKAQHRPSQQGRWLAAASLAYGLAVGARPNLLPGAVVLFVPVVQTWRERGDVAARKRGPPKALAAAVVPIALIGFGLMLYNFFRFDNPFEFGWHYVLAGPRRRLFNVRYLWFNFRVYFLGLTSWSARFPFVRQVAVPRLPVGYDTVEDPYGYGVLTNIPVAWLALAVPLVWRGRSGQAWSVLRWFVMAAALLFGMCVLPLGLYATATPRFEVDFLPALVLLTVIGILSLERALAATPRSGLTDRTAQQRVLRWCWSLLLGFSVAFNLLVSVKRGAEAHYDFGLVLEGQGKIRQAMEQYEQALRFNPDYAEAHNHLGAALLEQGRLQEAIGHCEQALRIKPDFADAHSILGIALLRQGRQPEAVSHWEQALRLNPDYAEAHNNLGAALHQQGKTREAVEQFEQALRIKPDFAEAHDNLGNALRELGRPEEAIGHYERALQIRPDDAETHYNLGNALVQVGRLQEAVGHFRQAFRIKPDFAEAHNNLGLALEQEGRVQEALQHYEQALRINPQYAEAHNNLALALAQLGRLPEAIEHWQQALRIKPDYAGAHYKLGLALEKTGRVQEAIGHYEEALRLKPDSVQAQNALARARGVQ
jgi:tetratricopeptide (TPR) repeat protein